MKVRIVSYSVADPDFVKEAQEEFLSKNPDKEDKVPQFDDIQDLIAFCARVSNPSNQMNEETSTKLIKYLIKHAHWSPLEMVNACLEIDTTRDIAHQIVRHRSFAFQEFSQRYADPAEFGNQFVMRDARLQDTKNRQNSIEIDLNDDDQRFIAAGWENLQRDVIEKCKSAYEWAISKGIAKEQARAVLPEGLTKTRLYMNGTLRSWIHYIDLRGANGTQKEHMEIAHACAEIIARIFPLVDDLRTA
jgi:thymidylate synthase (FAD)